MKKTLLAVAAIAMLLVFSSAYNAKVIDSRVGYQAPNFTVSNADTTVSLQDLKGDYVLLTFWSSADAQSRISNMHYDRIAGASSNLQHIAVNYDRSALVFGEVSKIDNLQNGSQFFDAEGHESQLHKTYRISSMGYRTLLIDPNGEIISENPSDSELAQLI